MTPEQAAAAVLLYGTELNAARQLGIPRTTLQNAHNKAVKLGLSTKRPKNKTAKSALYQRDEDKVPLVGGQIKTASRDTLPRPKKGQVLRYILTCVQNNTKLHDGLWGNIQALAKHYDAKIMVSQYTYNKEAYGSKAIKPGTQKASDTEELWYDPRIKDYVYDKAAELAPGLVWCGEINILPTAVRPLSGFESYTGRASGIFPHPKLAMESIASGKYEPTKFNYTTGTLTQRNYIQRKAGQKADFHHCYGALLVEVTNDGWWVRQLNGETDGTIYNLTMRVKNGKITTGHGVKGINWGDIHAGETDPVVEAVQWGKGGVIDVLRPDYQFAHDILNFHSRNHHEAKDPHKQFERYVQGQDNVADEVAGVRALMNRMHRPWCSTVVVDSNHDKALERWLKEADARNDPTNAIFYYEAQLAKYKAIAGKNPDFHLLEWACLRGAADEDAVQSARFLRQDESYILCHDSSGGIECGMHGHLGPNGARGSAAAFAKMGRKANVGHTHSTGIHDGVWTAGTSSKLDLGYNNGPGSWSHSFIITYENGKRCISTIWKGKAWA